MYVFSYVTHLCVSSEGFLNLSIARQSTDFVKQDPTVLRYLFNTVRRRWIIFQRHGLYKRLLCYCSNNRIFHLEIYNNERLVDL